MADEFETDPDLELDPAFSSSHHVQESLGESLGQLNGMGLGDELQELDHQHQHQPSTPKLNSSSLSPESAGGGVVQNGGESLGGSLADELASAISPAAQRREDRRRMREEYGLDIEDDDQDDQEEEEEEELQQQQSTNRRRRGNNPLPIATPSPDPKSNRIQKSSDSSINNQSISTSREESQALRDEKLASENESIYNQNTSSLIDSMRCSDSFLKKLKDLDGKSNPNSNSSGGGGGGGENEYDSLRLETVSKEMIRNLQDHLLKRESQLREWREIEMNFNRIEGENGGGLAGLRAAGGLIAQGGGGGLGGNTSLFQDQYQEEEKNKLDLVEEEDGEGEIHSEDEEQSNTRSNNRRRRGGAATTPITTTSNNQTSTALDLPPLPSPSESTSNQLNHLILLNSSLISSLNHLHDQVQVQRAGMAEVGKRLRNLKSVFAQWKLEWEGVEKSRKWIENWEGQNQSSSSSSSSIQQKTSSKDKDKENISFEELGFVKKPENIKDWTNQQLERFGKILNDAHVNARKLLDPVQITPEIEALIEKGRGLLEKDEKLNGNWSLTA